MRIPIAFVSIALALAGCPSTPTGTDAGPGGNDAFVAPIDGNGFDVNAPPPDAFVVHEDAGSAPASVAQRAHDLAMTLRGDAHFLIGMGNDLDGPPDYDADMAGVYTLGTTLDIHY